MTHGRDSSGTTPAGLPFVHDTVVHMLMEAARQAPDAVALRCGDEHLTYREYLRCVVGFAAELRQYGKSADRVALICSNSIDMAIAMFAVHAAGMQEVPINPSYTARELEHILTDCAPVAVVHDRMVAERVTGLRRLLGPAHPIEVGGNGRSLTRWRDLPAAGLPGSLPAPDALATLQYTGGTTGAPKGVDITHRQLSVNISQREALWPTLAGKEVVLCVMPLFHVFASSMCLHLAAYCRSELLILARYHPDAVLDALEHEGVTLLPVGPTIYHGLMATDRFAGTDFSTLRRAYSGSAPLPEDTLGRWRALTGTPILEGYGQTEAGPVLCVNRDGAPIVPGSVGEPLPGTTIQIVDTDTGTHVLEPGHDGEIRACGPQIMSGYRNREAETAQALRDGWLYTGDIGHLDERGILYITDRKKDMALVGGYNVYPREIDEVLFAHPDVVEAAAIGVPDAYRGEVIHAFVVAAVRDHDIAARLERYCREQLAGYKVPAAFHIVTELPRTTVGKIDKAAIRASPIAAGEDDGRRAKARKG